MGRCVQYVQKGLCSVLIVLLAACATKRTETEVQVPSHFVEIDKNQVYLDANVAYTQQDYTRALALYTKAVQDPAVSKLYKQESYVRMADIKIALGEYKSGLYDAISAVKLNNALVNNTAWHKVWHEGIVNVRNDVALKASEQLLLSVAVPQSINPKVLLGIACIFWKNGYIERGLSVINIAQYSKKNKTLQQQMETQLNTELATLPMSVQNILYTLITPSNRVTYPYNVFAYRYSLILEQEGDVEAAILLRKTLAEEKALRNTDFLKLQELEDVKEVQVVFLLPLSEPYKKYTWQIVNGANVAQEQLKKAGKVVKVYYVNTLSADWQSQLNKFPKGTIVAGPLRGTVFSTLQQSNLLEKYVFFTFMSKLPEGVEGSKAWRFYLSQEDQVNTMIQFARSLGIARYGVFYPSDEYGKTMAALFRDVAQKNGVSVDSMNMYSGNAMLWTERVAELLQVRDVHGAKVPNVSFSATFLPDTFLNATIVVPAFFYNGEQRQVFLGTSLWEERKATENYIPSNFTLAVYPSAWNPESKKEEAGILQKGLQGKTPSEPTRWSALGYDFVRFAEKLYIARATKNVQHMNRYLAKNPLFSWSLAPIVWDGNGIAAQRLFVLTPSGDSGKLVNRAVFAEQIRRAYRMHNARIESIYRNAE